MSLVAIAASILLSQGGQKPKTNPPKPSQTAPTLGTVQLPGDNGKVGVTYQLGAKGRELHFTLDSATVGMNFSAPEDSLVAGENQRILILNFTVQNPQKEEIGLSATTFGFTAVSPDDENFKFSGYVLGLPKKGKISQSLKPAQKVKCVVAFPIYATGPVTKVMVSKGDATPILRYDLTGKLVKMESAFSKDGIDLDQTTKFPMLAKGETLDMGEFGVTYNGWEFTTEKIKGYSPSKGYKYLVIKTSYKNLVAKDSFLSFAYFDWTVSDAAGQKLPWNKDILFDGTDTPIYQKLVFGEDEIKGRVYYQVPETMNSFAATLTHVASKRKVKLDTN
jgi:hypothetical protein